MALLSVARVTYAPVPVVQDIIVITSMREAWKRDRSVLEKYKSLWQIIIDGF